jgi:hypothetical protein
MADRTNELKHRVNAKKAQLTQKLEQLKAEAHGTKTDEIEKLEKSLQDVNDTLKSGWENLSEDAVARLNDWLK